MCKLLVWSGASSATTATFHLLLMSLDRVVSIKAPLYYDTRVKLGKASFRIRDISVASSVGIYVCSGTNLFLVSINDQTGVCGLSVPTVFELSLLMASLLIEIIAPFLILLASNLVFAVTLLTRRLRKDRNRRPGGTVARNGAEASSQDQEQLKAAKEKAYVKMLFILTSSFLIFNMASYGSMLVTSEDSETASLSAVALFVLFTVMNHTTNFCFYVISGAKFRQAFTKALCGDPSGRRRSDATASTATTRVTQPRGSGSQHWETHIP